MYLDKTNTKGEWSSMARELTVDEKMVVEGIREDSVRDAFVDFLCYESKTSPARTLVDCKENVATVGGTVSSAKLLDEVGNPITVAFEVKIPLSIEAAVALSSEGNVLYHVWNDNFSKTGTQARQSGIAPKDRMQKKLAAIRSQFSKEELREMLGL